MRIDEPDRAMRLCIRSIAAPDLPKVAEMLAQSFHGDCNRLLYGLFRLGIYEDLRQRVVFPRSRQICWVASERGPSRPSWPQLEPIAGTVEIDVRQRFPWPFVEPNYVYLSNLAVASQERRRGVASQLLLHCEKTAQGWGFGAIYLHVMEDNDAARRLYHRLGYRVCGVESSIGSVLLGQSRRLMLQKLL
jgi:ribosomal protein S18 acetylase RimI-like enzyme